jgi:gliding motility-associated-like protein
MAFGSVAQTDKAAGKEFWFGFMESIAPEFIRVYITAGSEDANCLVKVSGVWNKGVIVTANRSLFVDIPIGVAYNTSDEIVDYRAVRVTSDKDIEVRIANISNSSTDASTIIPLKHLPNAPVYIINTLKGEIGRSSQILLVAPENSTEVEITPSVKTLDGRPAGIPYTVNMESGTIYQIKGKDSSSLAGTEVKVIGECKKLIVLGGNECATVNYTNSCNGCDHLFEQLLPISFWGRDYLTTPFAETTEGYNVNIVSTTDNNRIFRNGILIGIINRGESLFHEIPTSVSAHYSADEPISLLQLMKSGNCLGHTSGNGDPSMMVLNPFHANSKRIAVKPVHTVSLREHWINIIVKTSNSNRLTVDGNTIPQANFIPSAIPGFSYTSISVDDSIHFIESDSGFDAISYGYGANESYAMQLSQAYQSSFYHWDLNTSTICDNMGDINFRITGDSAIDAYWTFGDGMRDSGLNINYDYGSENDYQVMVVVKNNNEECPSDTLEETLSYFDAPSLDLGPKDTVICDGEVITFNPGVSDVEYLWQNGSNSNNYFTRKAGWVVLIVTDENGCWDLDSINVIVSSCEDSSFTVPNVFTPNGDGINDRFEFTHFGFPEVNGVVMNRWGQVVYKYDIPAEGFWNGKVNNSGPECPSGTYYYVLNFSGSQTEGSRKVSGIITLLRER